ncbi:MAG: 50S ribosomal protein L22 [Bacteroidia bacterium]|nr:50S ribosomal protein L22 [Bacteroidia bacterium]
MARELKEAKRKEAFAVLRRHPSSPRKMRLVADLIRNQPVDKALNILAVTSRAAARPLRKLLLSALNNWEQKNPDPTEALLNTVYVKKITVDSAGMMIRIRPAPQGRAYRIRKRSNHVTVVLDAEAKKEE